MLFIIILSLGAVYAFIPIIIIIILILAARGAAGRDFFEMFGISALVGAAGGIAAGGSGKGLAGSGGKKTKLGGYKPNAAPGGKVSGSQIRDLMDGGGGSVGTTGVKYRSINDIKSGMQKDKVNILNQMQPDEIRRLLVDKGFGAASTFAVMGDVQLRDIAAKDLSLSALSNYYARYISTRNPQGSPGPLGAPQQAGMNMSVAAAYQLFSKQMSSGEEAKKQAKLKLTGKSYKYRTTNAKGDIMLDNDGNPVKYKPFSKLLLDAPSKKKIKEWPLGSAAVAAGAGAAVGGGALAAGAMAAGTATGDRGVTTGIVSSSKVSGSYQGSALLEQMSPDQILDLCRHFGLDVPMMEKEQMIAFASNRLSAQQIQEYLNQSGAGATIAGAAGAAAITNDNFYKVLGLDSKPKDLEATRKAYLAKMKEVHPDVSKDPNANEETIKANAAYEHAKKNAKKIWGDDSKS